VTPSGSGGSEFKGVPEGVNARREGDRIVLSRDGKDIGHLQQDGGGSAWAGFHVHDASGKRIGHATTVDSGFRSIDERSKKPAWGSKPTESRSNIDSGGWNGQGVGGQLTSAEHRAATMKWNSLSATARKHQGISGPPEGDAASVSFPNPQRAAGFYDEMISSMLTAKKTGSTVLVRKPRLGPS
jgi:hypothetical protein